MTAVPTLTVGDQTRTAIEIAERAARLATALVEAGVKPGDAVAVLARNDFVCLEATLATQRIDAFVVLVNWHWAASEVGFVFENSGAKVVLAHDEFAPLARSVLPAGVTLVAVRPSNEASAAVAARAPGELDYDTWLAAHAPSQAQGTGRESTMIYTSGTTGRPKAVRRLPASPEESIRRRDLLRQVYNGHPGTRALTTGPLYHLVSIAAVMNAWGAGGSAFVMPRFDAEEVLRMIERHRITDAYLVPTMFVRLLRLPADVRQRYDLSSLQCIHHSAAPCPPDVKRAMIDWLGPILRENYGCSETGMVTFCNAEEWLRKPGTVGRPVPNGEVRVYDDDGRRLPAGSIGEVFLKVHGGPDFTYHGNEEARARIDREGFVTAGDIGYLDEDGYLFLCDRKSDMLISGGVNVYPKEIEDALLSHEQVVDAAVFGVPDDELGEKVAAHVQRVPGSTLSADELQQYLRGRLAGYKLPRHVVFEEALPRQDNGKIYKRAIRDRYWEGRSRRI